MLPHENYRDTISVTPIGQSFSQSIAKSISLQGQNTKIVLLVGTARSGTTAFVRLFSEVGVESWYQPIKQIMRGRIYDKKEYSLSIADAPYVMIKETFGGLTEDEIWFNPIEILMETGIAKQNIHLITIMREPIAVACSLIRNLETHPEDAKVSSVRFVEKYARAYAGIPRLLAYAKEHEIEHTPIVYELLSDHDPEVIRRRLFDRVGIVYTGDTMNWSKLPPIETTTKFSKFTTQGDAYINPSLHATLNNTNGLTYCAESADELAKYVTDSERLALRESGVFDLYQTYREMCYAFWERIH